MDQETRGQELFEQQLRRRMELEEEIATRAMILALATDSQMDVDLHFEEICPRGQELLDLPTHRKATSVVAGVAGTKRTREQVLAGLGLLAQALELTSILRHEANVYSESRAPRVLQSQLGVEEAIVRLMADLGRVLIRAGEDEWDVDLLGAEKTDREKERVELFLRSMADRENDARRAASTVEEVV